MFFDYLDCLYLLLILGTLIFTFYFFVFFKRKFENNFYILNKFQFCHFPCSKKEKLSHGFTDLFQINEPLKRLKDLESFLNSAEFGKIKDVISLNKSSEIIECNERHFIEIINPGYYSNFKQLKLLLFRDVTNIILPFNQKVGELSKRNQLLNEIVQKLPIPIWLRSSNDDIFICNERYREIVNIKNEESFIPEISKSSASITKSARQNNFFSEDKHIIAGHTRKLFNITEMRFQDDKLLGFALDRSEKEEISIELQQYLDAQNNFLESSSSAVSIYSYDTKIKYFNQAYINMWGLDEKWLHTRPTYSEIIEVLRRERKLPEQANFLNFKKERLRLFTELSETKDEFLFLPDGRSVRLFIIPFAHMGLLFAFEDMTSRLALERSFNSLSAVHRAMINNLSEAIAVFGQDGRLKLFNPAYLKLWGLTEEYAVTAPHISEILESVRNLFNITDNNWLNVKNDLISVLYEREFQRTAIKLKNDIVIFRVVAPLPDGATLITYVNNSELVKCQITLNKKNMIINDIFLNHYQFIISANKQLEYLINSAKNKNLNIESFTQNIENQLHEMVELSKDNLASINLNFTSIDTQKILEELVKKYKQLNVVSINSNFSNYFNGIIIGNKNRITKILSKIFAYICELSTQSVIKIETRDIVSKVVVEIEVKCPELDKDAIEYKFWLLQSLVDIYNDKLSLDIKKDYFILSFETNLNEDNLV